MENLNEQIQELSLELKRKEQIDIHLDTIEESIRVKTNELESLELRLKKEEADVEQLKKMSLGQLFTKFLGKHESKIEREEEEALAAFLAYDSCHQSLTALHYEHEVLKKAQGELFDIEERLNKLLLSKETKLRFREDSETGSSLRQIERKLFNHLSQKRELGEAAIACQRALEELTELGRFLAGIHGWGNAHKSAMHYYGKGRYSSYAKKQYVETMKGMINNANIALERLHNELMDVFKHHNLNYERNIHNLINFAAVLYDNLITDWIVRKQVHHALFGIENLNDKIQRILLLIEDDLERIDKFIEDEQAQRREILLNLER